jgi:hypothetical protein
MKDRTPSDLSSASSIRLLPPGRSPSAFPASPELRHVSYHRRSRAPARETLSKPGLVREASSFFCEPSATSAFKPPYPWVGEALADPLRHLRGIVQRRDGPAPPQSPRIHPPEAARLARIAVISSRTLIRFPPPASQSPLAAETASCRRSAPTTRPLAERGPRRRERGQSPSGFGILSAAPASRGPEPAKPSRPEDPNVTRLREAVRRIEL